METVEALSVEAKRELAIVVKQMERVPYYRPNELDPRLTRAAAWIEAGRIVRQGDGTYYVPSQSRPGAGHLLHDTACDCEAATKGGTKWCVHAVAVQLYKEWEVRLQPKGLAMPRVTVQEDLGTRVGAGVDAIVDGPMAPSGTPEVAMLPITKEHLDAQRHTIRARLRRLGIQPLSTREDYEQAVLAQTGLILAPENFALIIGLLDDLLVAHEAAPPVVMRQPHEAPTIDRKYLKTIQGKDFVLYAGMLALAHAHGLQSLVAKFISVTSDLVLAEATAVFADGRTFTEAGDATPANVSAGVKAHFARVALTRAKARCLRDALNIGEVAVEEME